MAGFSSADWYIQAGRILIYKTGKGLSQPGRVRLECGERGERGFCLVEVLKGHRSEGVLLCRGSCDLLFQLKKRVKLELGDFPVCRD